MNKFKVGDKVKIIRKGKIGIIKSIVRNEFDTYGTSYTCYEVCTKDFRHYYTVHDIELVPEILTEKEKEYLSGVIKPFKDKIVSITKKEYDIASLEFIEFTNKYGVIFYLPDFEEGKYYKNMEAFKFYTLEELGL